MGESRRERRVRCRCGIVLGFGDRLRDFELRVRSNCRLCSCGVDGRDRLMLFSSRRLRA